MGRFKYLLLILFAVPAFGTIASHVGPRVTSVRTVYSSTNVGLVTPVVILNSTVAMFHTISIFDSSAQTMELIITYPSGLIDYLLIPPGGGNFALKVTLGSQVALLAISSGASVGESDINFY